MALLWSYRTRSVHDMGNGGYQGVWHYYGPTEQGLYMLFDQGPRE